MLRYTHSSAVAQGICDRSWHKVRCKYGGCDTARHGTDTTTLTHALTHSRSSWAPRPGHRTCTAKAPWARAWVVASEGTGTRAAPCAEHPGWPARRAAPLSPHLTPPHTTSPPAPNANFPSLSLFGFIAHPRPLARGTVQSVQFNSPRGSIKIWMCP